MVKWKNRGFAVRGLDSSPGFAAYIGYVLGKIT